MGYEGIIIVKLYEMGNGKWEIHYHEGIIIDVLGKWFLIILLIDNANRRFRCVHHLMAIIQLVVVCHHAVNPLTFPQGFAKG